jgi:hypothetical protein
MFIICMLLQACSTIAPPIQIATIDYNYSGCFGGGESKLVLFKQNEKIMARLEERGKANLLARVSPLQMDTFNLFIKQLKTLDLSGLCTTQESYIVNTDNEEIKKTDGTCEWEGFSRITKCLFGEHGSQNF